MSEDEMDAVRGVLLCWWMWEADKRTGWQWAPLSGASWVDEAAARAVGLAERACVEATPRGPWFSKRGLERGLAYFDRVAAVDAARKRTQPIGATLGGEVGP